ncbi:MAG: CPXCG motif-containing cysteine-rich protein [Stenotrophobium sp.]
MLEEAVVICPACWEEIVLELDLSGGSAIYTEDCSVCCRPMTVHLTVGEDGAAFSVHVSAENE